MNFAGLLSGGAPVIKKYQIPSTVSVLGIPFITSAAGSAGLTLATTTSVADMIGCNLDTATFATAQGANSPEALCSLIINPDAIWQIFMSGGATAGTVETQRAVTTASTDGLSVTTNTDWSSPTTDEGTIWGVTGANAGQVRKITSVSTTAATVTVAFANDTVVGDLFGYAPVQPNTLQSLTLTSDLSEFRQDVAVATNTAKFICIEIRPNNWVAGTGRPYILAVARDHILNPEA
jgi:hypothetical protein